MKTYATPTAFRRALEDRLSAAAKSSGMDLQRVRRRVAFDRLLQRLFMEPGHPWLLKGGYALELKLEIARTTKDLDLGISDKSLDMEGVWEALQDAASADVGDYFEYTIGAATMDLDGPPYGGARYPVTVKMDGRMFANFHLDVGAGDIQQEPFEWTSPTDWLGFAGIDAGKFPSIAREEHFAQKIHAYTTPRGDRINSRVKDLVDLVLLIDAGGMDTERLSKDIQLTFKRRKTHELPKEFAEPPGFWTLLFARLATECAIDPPDIQAQHLKVREYLRQAKILG